VVYNAEASAAGVIKTKINRGIQKVWLSRLIRSNVFDSSKALPFWLQVGDKSLRECEELSPPVGNKLAATTIFLCLLAFLICATLLPRCILESNESQGHMLPRWINYVWKVLTTANKALKQKPLMGY
jgi:hypothetical protein